MKANVNGIETYYEIHGKEGAPWLVFSHSLACSVRMWDGEIARAQGPLPRARVRHARPRPERGAAGPVHARSSWRTTCARCCKHLKIEKPHYVGLSMGGMIGQTAALKYPGIFRELTLADTTSRYPRGGRADVGGAHSHRANRRAWRRWCSRRWSAGSPSLSARTTRTR